ncbi:hypothetical protein WJX73_005367 [Symbiochloris irregularis]|uniref:OPA3-like protein n=1 Tax=Symbiochloris irregularis TaxID=706552 RepID=A0AAW1P3P7_9CHLO
MAFLFKAFTLTIRTAAKPLANRFERYVVNHPTLRPRVIQLAQTLHAIEIAISRGAEGKTGRAFVGTMTEERALESAGKIASEGFILAVGITILGWEYRRQAGKDEDKKVREEESRRRLVLECKEHSQQQLMAHQVVLASMQARMEGLEEQVRAMQERKLQRSSSWSLGLMGR